MKKLIFANLPVALALCVCTACSDTESISAPSEMCWDEEMSYSEASHSPTSDYVMMFMEQYDCPNLPEGCQHLTITVHRCVGNVEFK